MISLPTAAFALLMGATLAARADTNPDFDDDAKPILRMQPGLLQYVEARFDVKDTGTAKYPGDDDRRPSPPYIFRARPIGSHGPFNLRLLIQPGQPGHILGVVDITKVHMQAPGAPGPAVANQPPPQSNPAPASEPRVGQAFTPPSSPAPAQEPAPAPEPSTSAPSNVGSSEPTADTPSGPIMGSGNSSNASGQTLAPPPDPAPNAQ